MNRIQYHAALFKLSRKKRWKSGGEIVGVLRLFVGKKGYRLHNAAQKKDIKHGVECSQEGRVACAYHAAKWVDKNVRKGAGKSL